MKALAISNHPHPGAALPKEDGRRLNTLPV
jgi:hypothetical protein